jgi:hypothetical protein
VVNGTKVRRPVFLLGAPHSGADLVARAIRHSAAFHLTMGRPNVVRTVYAFARRPSIATERGAGAARVMRDAYAQSWQVVPHSAVTSAGWGPTAPAPTRAASSGSPTPRPT